jgi:hypothetical protein
MKLNILKINSSFCFLAIIFVSSVLASPVQAIIAPEIYFTEINIPKDNFNLGETISGTISLWNYENSAFGGLSLRYKVLEEGNIIDLQQGKEMFSLGSGEKATKNFNYTLPGNLPDGSFTFRVQLTTPKGEELGWTDKTINVKGNDNFLLLNNGRVTVAGEDFPPSQGVYYKPGESPEISFNVTNLSKNQITAFSKTTINKWNISNPINETEGEGIIFAPGKTQTVKMFLPPITNPEVYLAQIKYYDKETKKLISNPSFYRWIISGTDDAQILFVSTDKTSYQAGEEAKINLTYAGPADPKLTGEKGLIRVEILNEKGESIGKTEQEVDLKVNQATIAVLLTQAANNPKVIAQIIKDGKILDDYKFNIGSVVKNDQKGSWLTNNKITIILIILLVILIALYLFIIIKRRGSKTGLSIFFLMFVASAILWLYPISFVSAVTWVKEPDWEAYVTFNKPIPNQIYNLGSTVIFEGAGGIAGCGNAEWGGITQYFYITEDKDTPGVCSAPPPANPNVCEVLNTSPQCKTRKLGELFWYSLSSCWGSTGCTSATFSKSFTIPLDLGFSGPVRFYTYKQEPGDPLYAFMGYQLGCIRTTCPALGKSCGTWSDACGGTLNCGICSTSQTCQNGTCVCTPTTCAALGKNCGTWSDGCSGTLNCGSCAAPNSCQGGVCTCMPITSCPTGRICGPWPNGCGVDLNCGTCVAPQTCQNGTCVCTPTTCAALGKNCGSWSDGCSGTLNCGSCATPSTCQNGVCGGEWWRFIPMEWREVLPL